jgi:hypothetical protein
LIRVTADATDFVMLDTGVFSACVSRRIVWLIIVLSVNANNSYLYYSSPEQGMQAFLAHLLA